VQEGRKRDMEIWEAHGGPAQDALEREKLKRQEERSALKQQKYDLQTK